MKILFMGTPDFAVPSLEALMRSGVHEVVGVVTQPDRAVKRGKIEPSAVKRAAQAWGLDVFQPDRIGAVTEKLKTFGADIAVTAAYGQLLTQGVLDAFPCGVINVHASVLPMYRGASPIASAIADGRRETGVTIMRTELGLDTGDILSCVKTEIGDGETAGELTARLAVLGAKLLVETLDGYADIRPIKQDDKSATRCRTIKKSETFLDYNTDAKSVVNKIRALAPVPCAKTVFAGEVYKIYRAAAVDKTTAAASGEIIRCDDRLIIACADGAVEVLEIQAPSKRALIIADFLRGRKFPVGTVCGKI